MGNYKYSRSGFKSLGGNSLFESYCKLVAIELALKENLGLIYGSGNGGHDIPNLLAQFSSANAAEAPTVNAIKTKLEIALSDLWYQDRSGSGKKVPSKSYPNMRYLRHQSGAWIGGNTSTDAQVLNLKAVVSQAVLHFTQNGVIT